MSLDGTMKLARKTGRNWMRPAPLDLAYSYRCVRPDWANTGCLRTCPSI